MGRQSSEEDSTTVCLICLHSQRTPCPCPALPKTFQDTRRQRDEPPSLLFLWDRGEIIIINIKRKKKKEKNSSSSWLFSLFPPSCSAFCICCFFSFPAPSFRNKCQQVCVPMSQSLLSFFPLSGSFSFLLFLCFCLSPPSSSNFSFQDDHAKNGIRKRSSRVGWMGRGRGPARQGKRKRVRTSNREQYLKKTIGIRRQRRRRRWWWRLSGVSHAGW